MIGRKFKFNAILRLLLLSGSVCASELPGENKTVPAKEMAAPSDKEFGGSGNEKNEGEKFNQKVK